MTNAYATCHRHVLDAVEWAAGKTIEVRAVHDDDRYKCKQGCDRPADFYLVEVVSD